MKTRIKSSKIEKKSKFLLHFTRGKRERESMRERKVTHSHNTHIGCQMRFIKVHDVYFRGVLSLKHIYSKPYCETMITERGRREKKCEKENFFMAC